MKKREEQKLKDYKQNRLAEGFLDGEDEVPASSDTVAPEELEDEVEELDEPEEETEESDIDISEEPSEDGEEEIDLADDSEEEFEGEDTGVEEETANANTELKDAIATLTTEIQALKDAMAKQNEPAESEESNDDIDIEDDSSEDSEESSDDESSDDESSDEESSDEGSEESDNDSEDDSDFEGDESSDEESSDDESSDDEESSDETKSEAYNYYMKKGRCLNEQSGYLISMILNNRLDKLEEPLMAVVKSKIRQRIEESKKEFRQSVFTKKFGEQK